MQKGLQHYCVPVSLHLLQGGLWQQNWRVTVAVRDKMLKYPVQNYILNTKTSDLSQMLLLDSGELPAAKS